MVIRTNLTGAGVSSNLCSSTYTGEKLVGELQVKMNKLLQLDNKKIKKMIYGKSGEIAEKMEMRSGLLSKKINGHTIITLEEINRLATALGLDTLEILKQVYPDPTD